MKKIRVLFVPPVAALVAALLALSLFSAPASANAAGDQDQIDIGTAAWAERFVWRNVDNAGTKECRRGRTYTFYLAGRPNTGYLTAESKLRLRIRKDGEVFTRRVGLDFGDGSLAWMPFVGKQARVVKATVIASGEGARPRQGDDWFCGRP